MFNTQPSCCIALQVHTTFRPLYSLLTQVVHCCVIPEQTEQTACVITIAPSDAAQSNFGSCRAQKSPPSDMDTTMRYARSTGHIKEIAKLAIAGATLQTLLLTQTVRLQAVLCNRCSTAHASYAQCTKSSTGRCVLLLAATKAERKLNNLSAVP
jgi:hypothetical protein